jgi:hypothetical protein
MHFVRFDGDRSPQLIFVDVTGTAALSAVSSTLKKPYCRVKGSIINIVTADVLKQIMSSSSATRLA